ncbi:hypothetical protein ACG1BZ_21365 [Microbulbifer sp. CNSA002]|uniref:hypothetical protein n=1 Tax=Microbulbifer sp. CNSA002 TaxID=3373604 RepID=UPI0039B5792A
MSAGTDDSKIELNDEDGAIELIYRSSKPQVSGVIASKEDGEDEWYVFVNAAEFVRDEPLESKLRKVVHESLLNVNGVKSVEEADREEWLVMGNPDGKDLVRACINGLKSIESEIEVYINSFSG